MKRGDIIVVAAPGSYGKPRPAVVIQADALTELESKSIALCLMTGVIRDAPFFRMSVAPSKNNGLEKPSQIMVEKLVTVPREKIDRVIGRLSADEVQQLNRRLAFVVGLG